MPSPEGKVARRSRDGRGVTAVRFRRKAKENETLYRTSPAPYGGTLPKGEGLRLRRETIIYFLRFSICPDWITGGLGSVISQEIGFFSSSFMYLTSGDSMPGHGNLMHYPPFLPGTSWIAVTASKGARSIPPMPQSLYPA